jgi:hypothetical protein
MHGGIDVLVKDGLGMTGAIAEIDKDDGAMIAAAMRPPHEKDFLSGVLGAELTAHVSAAEVA